MRIHRGNAGTRRLRRVGALLYEGPRMTRPPRRAARLLALCASLSGACGGETTTPLDATTDAPLDATTDTPVDVPVDTPLDTPVDVTEDRSVDAPTDAPVDAPDATARDPFEGLGAVEDPVTRAVRFRVFSARATRVELSVYASDEATDPALSVTLDRDPTSDVWSVTLTRAQLDAAGVPATIRYGYRAWGPNWPYAAGWTPGSELGFITDVNDAGDRFNPNKLLIDPYAREITHDPVTLAFRDGSIYGTGPRSRRVDSGPHAPRSLLVPRAAYEGDVGARPTRPFRDDVIYEVHARGLTMADPDAPTGCAGTYAAAAARADYLAALGVTAVEFLPVQETQNDANDPASMSTRGMNYWGYSTLAYFAPDRRYACDRSPGGPTREFRAMVRSFHARGIKVYVDVVFNHTAEGGAGGAAGELTSLFSMRGLDNASYYQLSRSGHFFQDNSGVGANVATNGAPARRLVLDALRYWTTELGVDGYRFDLAPVLGNTCGRGCFRYERDAVTPLTEAVRELPARPSDGGPGVDLIAEPWGIGDGTYQLGNFPAGWSEWNDRYRDLMRQSQNQLDVARVTPGWISARIAGSSEQFRPRGRGPAASVNFIVAHDGFTLFDLYHCNGPNNTQPWPYGPSDGGSANNLSWDQAGDPARQRQAARTGLALLMTSAGVPMITGGDEMLRSLRCNNNPYNLDSDRNWLDWTMLTRQPAFATFARRMIRFRGAHPALRPRDFWMGRDRDGDGVLDVTWLRADARAADGAYMDDPDARFLGWRVDGDEAGDGARSIYVIYNRGTTPVRVTLPTPSAGGAWFQFADTGAWLEGSSNAWEEGAEPRVTDGRYDLAARAVAVLIERAAP